MTESTRRDFLRKVASAAAAGTTLTVLPLSIRKALAIPTTIFVGPHGTHSVFSAPRC